MTDLGGRDLAFVAHAEAERRDPSRRGLEIPELVRLVETDGRRIRGDDPWLTMRSAVNGAHDLFDLVDEARWVWKRPVPPPTEALSGKALAEVLHAYVVERYPNDRVVHYEDVAVALDRRGVVVKGPDKGRTVRSALDADARFVSLGRGMWRWKE